MERRRSIPMRLQIVEGEGSKSALIHCKQCVRRGCTPVPCLMGFRAPKYPRQRECHPLDPAHGFSPCTPAGVIAPCTRNKGSAFPLTLRKGFFSVHTSKGCNPAPPFSEGGYFPNSMVVPHFRRAQLSGDTPDTPIALYGGFR